MDRRSVLRGGLLVAGLALLPLACGSHSESPSGKEESGRAPEQVLRDLVLRETSEGKLEWVLRAKRATRISASEPTRLESLRVDFYQGSDHVRSVLTSDSGRVDTQKGTLVATGRVVVVTPEGNRLETEELLWDRKSSRVSSEKFVRLTKGTDVLTGIGFQSDPNLASYEIKKDVRASVRDENGIKDEVLGADSSRTPRH